MIFSLPTLLRRLFGAAGLIGLFHESLLLHPEKPGWYCEMKRSIAQTLGAKRHHRRDRNPSWSYANDPCAGCTGGPKQQVNEPLALFFQQVEKAGGLEEILTFTRTCSAPVDCARLFSHASRFIGL